MRESKYSIGTSSCTHHTRSADKQQHSGVLPLDLIHDTPARRGIVTRHPVRSPLRVVLRPDPSRGAVAPGAAYSVTERMPGAIAIFVFVIVDGVARGILQKRADARYDLPELPERCRRTASKYSFGLSQVGSATVANVCNMPEMKAASERVLYLLGHYTNGYC
jgi:hypothetical protein